MGWVYLVHAVGTADFKIGVSENVRARVESLRTACPSLLSLVAAWRCEQPMLLERALLNLCGTEGVGGSEWVKMTGLPLDVFDDVARGFGGVRAVLDLDAERKQNRGAISAPEVRQVASRPPQYRVRWLTVRDLSKMFSGVLSANEWLALAKSGAIAAQKNVGSGRRVRWLIDSIDADRHIDELVRAGKIVKKGGAT